MSAHTPDLGATRLLSLAAAPTFAVMALLSAFPGGTQEALCSTSHGASPLTGMAAMYLLMSAFHSAPWLKLVLHRRSAAGGEHSRSSNTLS